jgi:hypothetical protein
VLDRCKDIGVILSKPKAQLFREKIEFLGLVIDKGKLQLHKHIGENITAFNSKITDRKQLQRFLGILNYISQFCPKVAQIRQPLQAKLKKDAFWQLSDSDTAYVDKIKKAIKNLPSNCSIFILSSSEHLLNETRLPQLQHQRCPSFSSYQRVLVAIQVLFRRFTATRLLTADAYPFSFTFFKKVAKYEVQE